MAEHKSLLSVGYLLTFGSIIGFSAYIWLLHHVRPALAGSYAYVNPVIAMALGAWLAQEHFDTADLGATGVILLGVVAITLAKARTAKPLVDDASSEPAHERPTARTTIATACGSRRRRSCCGG